MALIDLTNSTTRTGMFTEATFAFLDELTENNNRAWFEEQRQRYEDVVRTPALQFIAAMATPLQRIAPHFRAVPAKVGGSLLRIHRDTRFAKDKTPYKTNVGIQFRHDLGKDIHAPSFYVHVAPDGCFLGAGSWHPESDALLKIRQLIAAKPERWLALLAEPGFVRRWSLSGEVLTRVPRGFAADHPAAADLKRKDFIAMDPLSYDDVIGSNLVQRTTQAFESAVPLMQFLCDATGVQL